MRKTLIIFSVIVAALAQASSSSSTPTPVTLRFGIVGQMKTLSLDDISHLAKEQIITIKDNPAYEHQSIDYRGFKFSDILASLGNSVDLNNYKVVVTCTDGYRPVLDGELFFKGQAYLAYREAKVTDTKLETVDHLWTKVKMGDRYASPAPLYLVWDTPATYPDGWPFQIAAITLVLKSDFKEFDMIAPKGAFDSKVEEGYQVFSNYCIACHSINGVGATGKAPDLAHVTMYRNDDYIRSTIQAGKGVMYPFADKLTEEQIDSVVSYLKNIGATP